VPQELSRSTAASEQDPASSLDRELEQLHRARTGIAQVVFGLESTVDQLLIALMGGGHVLLEGAPGLGKTLLVRTLGAVCGLSFSRIQFTPDLMPADVTGTMVLVEDETGATHLRFQPGPIFAEMVLADEINRATPKSQSALLEAMQEGTVTAAGHTHPLPKPFFVLATQNPIEMEGTYQLPEAQIDRFFMKVSMPYPSAGVLDTILDRTTGAELDAAPQTLSPADILHLQALTRSVPMATHVRGAVVRFLLATQTDGRETTAKVQRYIRFGITPRGGQALVLAAKGHALMDGRFNVAFKDLRAVLLPALRHRFQLNFEGIAEGISSEELLLEVFERAVGGAAE
jgi:MoxR-like ATPase